MVIEFVFLEKNILGVFHGDEFFVNGVFGRGKKFLCLWLLGFFVFFQLGEGFV